LSSGDFLAQVNWTKYPSNPVLIGQPGTWYAYTTMNSVLYNADSSRYEMWFTAGAQIEFPYTIGFAWSSDGITWNVHSPNPVLTPTSGSWDAYMVLAPYVLRENGQYKMWYTGCQTNSLFFRIGYATSPDGINWTKHPSNPIFLPGTSTWELSAVAYPCIMPYSNGYKMWYGGFNANFTVTGIGYATSPDGITWERYTGNPVLPAGAGGQWDHVLFAPRVLHIDNIYYMFYSGETVVYHSDKIGLATSADGLAWIKYSSNPVLQPTSGQWDGDRTNSGYVILDADTLKMYYCGMPVGATNMQLGMATSPFTPLPLPVGTYTIGTGGNFATIQDAFNKLETDGVAGNVTLELIDELYTAPTDSFGFKLNGPIPGAGPNSRVMIKPAENKNVVLEGNGFRVMCLLNTSYVTIDGVDLNGATTIIFHALHNASYTWNDCLALLYDSDHNIVQNITFIDEDFLRVGGIWLNSNTASAPDSNLFYNNFIKKGGAMYLNSPASGGIRPEGNVIRGNFIGSESDSLISWGIQVERCKNTIVENNNVQNIKIMNIIGEQIILGINSYDGQGDIIRNNVVHNLRASSGYSSVGILLSGGSGNNNMVYNNMVYDIQSSSTSPDSRVSGIQIANQTNPKIYYNTVYLSGTGSNHQGSAAFYIYGGWGGSSGIDLKNNIFINTRDEGQYCASAIYDYSSTNLASDYNDLYYDNTNSYNCLVRIGNTKYNTLADWQATGKDLFSVSKLVDFVSATDLHLTGLSNGDIDLIGTPISNITTDIDGNTRNALYPYKGADEASVALPVELISFTAEAENQRVILKWTTATELNNMGFEVQRKVAESDFATIGFIRGEGTTTNQREYSYIDRDLVDGKYFYRLKQIDYNGTYEYTNAIEVDVRSLNDYALEQNYPNPFNPVTTIGYVLKEKATTKLVLLNAIGEQIALLVNEEQDKGYHKIDFNAANLPSGVYFYRLQAGEYTAVKKMLLIK